MAYVSLSMAVSAIYMWSYVYNIVRISSRDVTKEADNDGHGGSSSAVKDAGEKPELIQGNYSEAFRASKEFPVSDEYELLLPCTNSEGIAEVHLSDKIKQCFGMISRKLNLKAVLAPSTTAAIVGFIIGVVPQIRNSLIGASAPLHVVADSASLIGDASIPTVTLIVGGNLLRGLRGSGIQSSLIVGILAVRFVFLPLIGIAFVKGAVHFGLVHSDPLYQFVLLLHFAVPPALNIGTITQLFGAGESECSVIMLWAYASASIFLTLCKVYCEFQILNPNVHFIKAFGLRIILENGLDVDAALSNVIGPRVKFFDVNGRKVPGWTSISFCGDLRIPDNFSITSRSNQCVVSNIAPPKLGRYPEFVQGRFSSVYLKRSSEMGFLDLFVVAVVPVLKVLLITLVGLFLALDRIDLLGSTARPYLNNLIFYVFSPALVSSQLAGTITLQSLATLWFMPVNILLTFIIGSALAWILIKITRTPPHLQGLVIGCCSAGNLGNLLLIIVPAVCSESNSPFGDSTVCASYGMAYASLSMAVGAIYIWTYVFIIMRIYADNSAGNIENVSTADSESYTEALLPSSEKSSCHDHSAHGELPETLSDGKKVTFMERTLGRFKKFAANTNLKKVFAPATIAAICGFIIGIVSPIRKLMIGDGAPLRVLESSASLLGQASIPCMALIMGSNLLKGLKRSEISVSVIAGIVAVRNFFLPLIGIGIVKAAHHFGLVGSDSLYQFILLLQYALPPAMAIGVMAQLFKAGQSECSVIMLWCYVLAAFSLTLWSTFFMWLLG
ncbi:hypothetical protein OIU74_000768 [Salix koriyanagi]|uniref:Auxin efflux carrier family protein n=1 Tax=Salix koriyanagi TaxID=2511006 RepID=A0A9Q0X0Q1_9ROSI|nr:hypothetical protein OIU74_000768 [Salix koriyanagi]